MGYLNSILQNKFFKNSFILISGNIVAGFLGYLFQLLVSRKLSIEGYGEFQTLSSLMNILAVPTVAINFFIIKHAAAFFARQDHGSNLRFYRWLKKDILILTLIVSAIFLIMTPLIKSYLHLNEYSGLLFIVLIIGLGLAAAAPKGILNGWHDFKSLSSNNILTAVIKLIFGVTLVFIFATINSALLGFLAGALFSYVYLVIRLRKKNLLAAEKAEAENKKQIFDKQHIIKELKKYVLPLCCFSLLLTLLTSFDMLLVKNLASPELAGFYGAFNILSKIIFWASSSVVLVVLPMACAKNSIKQRLNKKILFYANVLILLICLAGFLAYFFFPNLIINLLFGAKYLSLAKSLWTFALMALALSLLTLEANLAYARYDFKISYILLATVISEIVLVYIFSHSLLQIALTVASVQFSGYVASLIYNQKASQRCHWVNLGEINP